MRIFLLWVELSREVGQRAWKRAKQRPRRTRTTMNSTHLYVYEENVEKLTEGKLSLTEASVECGK